MTVRPDVRLADAPMRPVGCGACGAQVLVRKSSWEQTSVQWNRDAMDQCLERRQAVELTAPGSVGGGAWRAGVFMACAQLRDSIEAAARDGALPLLDGQQ